VYVQQHAVFWRDSIPWLMNYVCNEYNSNDKLATIRGISRLIAMVKMKVAPSVVFSNFLPLFRLDALTAIVTRTVETPCRVTNGKPDASVTLVKLGRATYLDTCRTLICDLQKA
jgi:hypothetical protein